MKLVLHSFQTGAIEVAEVPAPELKRGHLLIQSIQTLVSAGTERMLLEFGRSNYLVKARQQPEKVKMALEKVKTDGLFSTIDAVRSKLDQPIPMGYSNVGRVIGVGAGVEGYSVGDLVASNGSHAEIVCVPKNLCAKVPEGVRPEDAAFTVVAAIALQGVRLACPSIGECFVVTGLGLIGLLTVQILKAHGCRVLGLDFDQEKLSLAKKFGAEVFDLSSGKDPISAAVRFSRGNGVDAVLLTASTKSSQPVEHAAAMCRKRGRIVLVGVTGLEINRSDFYEKELNFQVSCSYGPGRYDPQYEEKGQDYPIAYVRWTEQRNFQAVLDLMASGSLKLDRLKTSSYPLADAPDAYNYLMSDQAALGVILEYSHEHISNLNRTVGLIKSCTEPIDAKPSLAAIGAGNYAGRVLLPAFKKTGARLKTIASAGGTSGTHYGRKLGFEQSTTDTHSIFSDDSIDAVVIATQHNSHAYFVLESLKAGKDVFVEKPLALTHAELDAIEVELASARLRPRAPMLMIGFNRRFAPLVKKLKAAILGSSSPMSIVYTCNAGAIPADSWIQDPARGGGRIIGEACHFVDIARFLADSRIVAVNAVGMDRAGTGCNDTATILLKFENGSIATIHYFANGSNSFPKERIEVFQDGAIFQLDNFRKLKILGAPGGSVSRLIKDKGQTACSKAFVSALETRAGEPIPVEEIIEVSRVCVDAWNQIRHS